MSLSLAFVTLAALLFPSFQLFAQPNIQTADSLKLPLKALSLQALPDLRNLDLSGWEGRDRLEGTARNAFHANRNRQKNRPWRDLSTEEARKDVQDWTFEQYVNTTNRYSAEIGLNLNPFDAKFSDVQRDSLAKKLVPYERQLVSVTGYLVMTYPGPPESCNSNSAEFHDWHLELLAAPLGHYPRIGDPTSIIAETTPHTEQALWASGIRLQKLAAFIRTGDPPRLQYHPTGSKPHKIRVTGYLFWDASHSRSGEDIGTTIVRGGNSGFSHPWRATAWEIHPILKMEDLGTEK